MGVVYRGQDVDLRRYAAIKILSEKHRDNKELRARFSREGRAVAAISHPNVVQIFSTGLHLGLPYIAMEYLDGVNLGTLVLKTGPCSSRDCARAILDATRGLMAAHKAGVLHRDIKPSNLVKLRTGQVKVTDFGLAKPLDPQEEPALTAMGVVVGTPDFIAPEQARGEKLTAAIDIYALGGTLYFLLAATPPFRTGDPAKDKYLKVVQRHLKEPAPNAIHRNPAANRELCDLGQRMMSKQVASRPDYQTLIPHLKRLIQQYSVPTGDVSTDERHRRLTEKVVVELKNTPFVGGTTPVLDTATTVSDMPLSANTTAYNLTSLSKLPFLLILFCVVAAITFALWTILGR